MKKDQETALGLRVTMDQLSDEDLAEYGRGDLKEGYHPRIHDTGREQKYLVIKELEYRSGRRRDREPSNLRLHVVRLEDVSVPDLRTWKNHDRYEVEEVTKDELWNRLAGDDETDFVYESDRRGDQE